MRPLLQPLSSTTRVVTGRREAVFAAWSEPTRLAQWWAEDAKPARTHTHVVIRELAAPERIVFTWGNRPESTTLVTATFTPVHGGVRTRIVLEQSIAKAPCLHAAVAARWGASLDRLHALLV